MEERKWKKNENGYPVWKDSGDYVHRTNWKRKYNLRDIDGIVVHHIDGDKMNFRRDNLIGLKPKDHEDLTKYMRKLRNENQIYGLLVIASFLCYLWSVFFAGVGFILYFSLGTIFLFLAFIIPFVPSWRLRKAMFMFRLIKVKK